MGAVLEQIYLTIVAILSLGGFLALAGYIIYASNSRWREYETLYAASGATKPLARNMTGMVRLSQPGYRWGHLSGDLKSHRHPPVFVGVHETGLSLSIMPPFKYGCRDLFLPFDKMTIEPAQWDFVKDAYGVQMNGVDGIEILMFSNILQWAATRSETLDLMLQRAELVRGMQRA
jgi:hypothetical protein